MWMIYRPDAVTVWRNSEVKNRLSRYYAIMNDELPAKFLVAKKVSVNVDLNENIEKLWYIHEKTSEKFRSLLKKIDAGEVNLENLDVPKVSYLDLKIEIAYRILQKCCFCERRCEVNRLRGERGFCRIDEKARVSTAFLHMGEEAPLVPSGTIFFAGCNFGPCVFCQNYDISNYPENGEEVTPEKLARIVNSLKREGARNVNWVGGEPTPNAYHIIASMKHTTVNIAQLWNSNMYCSKELMKLLLDIIDFWLPDFKYGNDKCAEHLSKVSNYWNIVSRNHKMAYDETVAQGTSGMIIRHLVLPNHVECCTRPILEWIAKNCPKALVNIMGQYRPLFRVPGNPEYSDIDRRPTGKEMEKAYKIADELNILWRPVS